MALQVEQLALGPFETNCYVVRAREAATDAVVVDPSDDAQTISGRLEERGARCAAILVTHPHLDHVLALADLAEATGAPVYAPAAALDALVNPKSSLAGFPLPRSWTPDVLLEGGEVVEAGGLAFEVTSVPGHHAAHVAYYTEGFLFSGDVLFAGSVGRTDLEGGSWPTLLASIQTLVDAYPPETVVCSGHGAATTLERELAANPFLAELRA